MERECLLNRLVAEAGGLGVLLEEEHVDDERKHEQSEDQADNVDAAGEESAELVDHQSDGVSEHALVTDGEPRPLGVVHLALDSADGREARSAQQVEHEERVAGDRGERRADVLPHRAFAGAVENAETASGTDRRPSRSTW